MAQHSIRRPLLVILAVGFVVSAGVGLRAEWQRRQASEAYQVASAALSALERQQAQWAHVLNELHDQLQEQTDQATHQKEEVARVQAQLADAQAQLRAAQREYAQLHGEHQLAQERLAAVIHDNQALTATLSSMPELKAAMRTARRQVWQQRWQRWWARAEAQRTDDERRLTQGNGGYVVRDGFSTLGADVARTTVQVRVLDPQLP